ACCFWRTQNSRLDPDSQSLQASSGAYGQPTSHPVLPSSVTEVDVDFFFTVLLCIDSPATEKQYCLYATTSKLEVTLKDQPSIPGLSPNSSWSGGGGIKAPILPSSPANLCSAQSLSTFSFSVLGKVLSAVGSAQLLMSQKFQQFRGLCEQNLNPEANPRPTAQDLAGFWDLLQLSIEDISMKFDELYHLKANSWQLVETPEKRKEEKKPPPPVPKKPAKSKPAVSRDKASDAGDKQRQEARKRLLAAKRAASVRQNSATESADSIEIYVPEAQTRL
uniref:DLG associated protein 4 n=1 Tax=Ursus americanus TaxID=9643 RepID=A0A452RE32_URSAM